MARWSLGYFALVAGGWASVVWATAAVSAEPAAPKGAPQAAAPGVQQIPEVAEAAQRFRGGDYDGALASLQSALKKHPELPPAHMVMANWFSQINQPQAAQAALEEAVREAPADPEAYATMAELAVRSGRTLEASLLYDKTASVVEAYQGTPQRKAAFQRRIEAGRAAVAEANRDWAGAQKHLEALLADDPKNATALLQLGRMLFQQQKIDEALERFRQAAHANENVWPAEVNLARLYEQAGDRAKATKWFVTALTANPRDLKTRVAATQWSLETEQLTQAREQADAALKIDPNALEALVMRGVVAMFLKDYEGATGYFEKAHKSSPANFDAGNYLALALAEQDDAAKRRSALEYAEANVKAHPGNPEALATLSWAYYKLSRTEEAENTMKQAFVAGRLGPDALCRAARMLVDRQKPSDAAQLLETALRTQGAFALRKEAEGLLEQLKKGQPKP